MEKDLTNSFSIERLMDSIDPSLIGDWGIVIDLGIIFFIAVIAYNVGVYWLSKGK